MAYGPFISWLWTEAGAQMELESSLGIGGFGYPAMAAINTRKMKFALLRGSFSETGIHEFLRLVMLFSLQKQKLNSSLGGGINLVDLLLQGAVGGPRLDCHAGRRGHA